MNLSPSISAGRSLLAPRPFKPGVALPLSLLLHGGVLLTLIIGAKLSASSGPLVDPDMVLMEVSMLAMPKQTTAMPQRASRAPDPVPAAPDPAPVKVEPVETTSELVDPTVKPPDGPKPVAESVDRDKLLRDMRRREALANLQPESPLGTEDRARTSPDGVQGATGSSRGSAGDPVLAAYHEQLRRAILPNFKPIQKAPNLEVILGVTIDRQGRILGVRVLQSSNDVSFDAAARRAVEKTGSVPPAPAELMRKDQITLPVAFTPKDAT